MYRGMNLSQEFNPLSSTLNQPLGDAALGEGALEPPNDIFGTSVSGPRHRGLQQKTKIQNEIKGLMTSVDLQNELVKTATAEISELDQEIGPIEANIQMAEGLKVFFQNSGFTKNNTLS